MYESRERSGFGWETFLSGIVRLEELVGNLDADQTQAEKERNKTEIVASNEGRNAR